MLKCPYCGSDRLQESGGENGNPFDRQPEKTICLDCGKTIFQAQPKAGLTMPDISAAALRLRHAEAIHLKKPIVVIEMTASGAGITRTERAVIPYKDGEYSLHDYPYPLSRFGSVVIRGDTIKLDGDISKLTGNVLETTKQYTAYAWDKHPEAETIAIKIYTDIQ